MSDSKDIRYGRQCMLAQDMRRLNILNATNAIDRNEEEIIRICKAQFDKDDRMKAKKANRDKNKWLKRLAKN